MEAIRSFASCLWESATFWKTTALVLTLLNLKTLPLVWHIRVYRYFFKYGYLITPAVEQPARPSTEILNPLSIYSRAPVMEIDFNMHKSNSTYFSDLDVSRTALMSSIVVKGAALLEKRLEQQGKKGFLGFILGSVYTNFKREIPAYTKYEVKSHIASFDQKWVYIVTYFLKPSTKKTVEEDPEKLLKRLYAVSISKYVLKKGRYTVPPKDAFEAAGYTPFFAGAAESDANGHATGAQNGHANGAAVQRKEGPVGDAEEWERLKTEIDRGLTVIQPIVDQEEKLLEDYVQKMSRPGFA